MTYTAAFALTVSLLAPGASGRHADDATVLKAALEDLCRGNYIVIDSTSIQPAQVEPDRLQSVPTAALQNLRTRNRNTAVLSLAGACPGARVASHSEIEKAFSVPAPVEPPDPDYRWRAFAKAFPGVASLVRLSLPGYSSRGKAAVVYLEAGRGSTAGEGWYVLLKKTAGKWHVVSRDSVWVAFYDAPAVKPSDRS
jgi:hypothetical protein